ncbi:glucosaminidase domain-containing protein [Labilibacter marinus]|uniref:glucosaminidase domain-containing protein n=1 Tax=Labilibacter marinus TaxID=1477105 RepID=UPI0009FA6D88|nr:glucosaminidase domain-containing protein [Labilibacter marinus]
MPITSLKTLMHFLQKKSTLIIAISVTIGVVMLLLQPKVLPEQKRMSIKICNSASVDSIVLIDSTIVVPVLYQRIPDLKDMHYKKRMVKFIHMMLPSVLMAREKMILERQKVLEVGALMTQGISSEEDSLYLEKLKGMYKTDNIDEVVKRLHPHPVSIILAQAAIESGWGTSRFCREANNIYGIWSYNSKEKRIKAGESRSGTNIYLRKYDSIFDSIYDYLLTISKANAYKQFREARLYSDNPYQLIWYLSNYSEKRYEYVRALRNVIEFNDLHLYDNYVLAEFDRSDPTWKELLD